jgi:hypothetical protein
MLLAILIAIAAALPLGAFVWLALELVDEFLTEPTITTPTQPASSHEAWLAEMHAKHPAAFKHLTGK